MAETGSVDIAYETFGRSTDPPVVLIAGLGDQLVSWPVRLCRALASRNHLVVRFDNRDVGRSSHLLDAPIPDPKAVARGDYASVSYRLADMAADVVGLLNALHLPIAHLVGHSMGGMIAQQFAIDHPERLGSLVSLSSAPGVADSWDVRRDALPRVLEPTPTEWPAYLEQVLRFERLLAVHPDFDAARERAELAFARGVEPLGQRRQFVAMHASGERAEALAQVRAPAMVVHGADDPLIGVRAGMATAAALPHARLLVFPEMGHYLEREHEPAFVDAVSDLLAAGSGRP